MEIQQVQTDLLSELRSAKKAGLEPANQSQGASVLFGHFRMKMRFIAWLELPSINPDDLPPSIGLTIRG